MIPKGGPQWRPGAPRNRFDAFELSPKIQPRASARSCPIIAAVARVSAGYRWLMRRFWPSATPRRSGRKRASNFTTVKPALSILPTKILNICATARAASRSNRLNDCSVSAFNKPPVLPGVAGNCAYIFFWPPAVAVPATTAGGFLFPSARFPSRRGLYSRIEYIRYLLAVF